MISSLSRLRKAHFSGNEGENGYIKAQDGKNSKDLTIYLPVGTLVYEMIREENYTYLKKDLRYHLFIKKIETIKHLIVNCLLI